MKYFKYIIVVLMAFLVLNVGHVYASDNQVEETVNAGILGEVSAKDVSLPVFSIIVGFVDGINPCAMWILIFLITMIMPLKDRKKQWIIGLTFLGTSALIYLLFLVSWLNLAVFLTKISLIRMIISVFAIIFGMVNIYRYIKEHGDDVGCDVTDANKRKKIMNKITKITSNQKFILSIIGTIGLAISVNVIELVCSLGLPVVFTNVLAINNLNTLQYIIYIFLYILFYMIDDILVFAIAMKTMHIKAISNKYTKYSHLIGGIIMLILGLLMALKPEWIMLNFG